MKEEIAGLAYGALCGTVLGGCLMGIFGVSPLKSDALKAGVAEYRITDPATGATEFRFVPCECKEAAQ